jgi:uncharacterized membrane protein YhaH (DUF805 family)
MQRHTKQTLLAAVVGLVLVAVCKMIYDLFVGLSVVPNLLLGAGLSPPSLVLEMLLMLSLLAVAFCVGTLLVQRTKDSPRRSAIIAALPWISLSLLSFAIGLIGEHGGALRELLSRTPSAFLHTALVTLSVPAGLLLAVHTRPKR